MIETPRLRLVPFAQEHLTERYLGWLNDPALMRYSDQRFVAHTAESAREYLASFAGTQNSFVAILLKEPVHRLVGTATIYVEPYHRVADLGILIGEADLQGHGYGTEAWRALIDFAIRLGMRKVTAGCSADNLAMLALMRKVGMVPDGRRIKQRLHDGVETDVIHAATFTSRAIFPDL